MSSEEQRGPSVRDGVKYTLHNDIDDAIAKALKDGLQRTCLTCIEFVELGEMCRSYNERPPARVIAYGCKRYTHTDEIPF